MSVRYLEICVCFCVTWLWIIHVFIFLLWWFSWINWRNWRGLKICMTGQRLRIVIWRWWTTHILLNSWWLWLNTPSWRLVWFQICSIWWWNILPCLFFANIGGWIAYTLVKKGLSLTSVRKVRKLLKIILINKINCC